jgi:hypothetical protein
MLFIVIYPSRNPSLQFVIEKQSQVLNRLHSSSWWPRIRSTQKMLLLGSYVAWVTEKGAGKHEVDLNTNILVYMHFHLPWCLPLDSVESLSVVLLFICLQSDNMPNMKWFTTNMELYLEIIHSFFILDVMLVLGPAPIGKIVVNFLFIHLLQPKTNSFSTGKAGYCQNCIWKLSGYITRIGLRCFTALLTM